MRGDREPGRRGARHGRWGGATLYDTTVAHVRQDPVRHAFRYRSSSWLVDLDELPRPPRWLRPLAGFRAADHLGRPGRPLRDNIDDYLAGHGIDLRGGRILMLASPRTFGYVFNPLSVFWCHDPEGALECVVAEVHNTYGERHAYLLHTDAAADATAEKAFYVSPFYPVDGHYRLRLPVPGDRLELAVTLHRPGERPFVATVRGTGRPAGTAELLRSTVRVPWVTAAVALRIRTQGLRLWARRLPVAPRPRHGPGPGFNPPQKGI